MGDKSNENGKSAAEILSDLKKCLRELVEAEAQNQQDQLQDDSKTNDVKEKPKIVKMMPGLRAIKIWRNERMVYPKEFALIDAKEKFSKKLTSDEMMPFWEKEITNAVVRIIPFIGTIHLNDIIIVEAEKMLLKATNHSIAKINTPYALRPLVIEDRLFLIHKIRKIHLGFCSTPSEHLFQILSNRAEVLYEINSTKKKISRCRTVKEYSIKNKLFLTDAVKFIRKGNVVLLLSPKNEKLGKVRINWFKKMFIVESNNDKDPIVELKRKKMEERKFDTTINYDYFIYCEKKQIGRISTDFPDLQKANYSDDAICGIEFLAEEQIDVQVKLRLLTAWLFAYLNCYERKLVKEVFHVSPSEGDDEQSEDKSKMALPSISDISKMESNTQSESTIATMGSSYSAFDTTAPSKLTIPTTAV